MTTIIPDLLGEPWVARRIPVTPSEAAPGADHAILVHQRNAGAARHARAALYIHGRTDYFFQTHLSAALEEADYEFYALEMRGCGRAGADLPEGSFPHDTTDLLVYDEEITEAVRILREEKGHDAVVLNAHSTGGLSAALWAADHPGRVAAVTLNSPWLDLNASGFMRSYGTAAVDLMSRWMPGRVIVNPAAPEADDEEAFEADPYARSLHAKWGGEWDWDLSLKPSPGWPARAGFLTSVRRLQRRVRHGLGIEAPVLLCCSTASAPPDAGREAVLQADAVLDVTQMVERAPFLGEDVTVRQIPGGVHDLALSPEPARGEYLATLTGWLSARLPCPSH